MVGIRDRFWAVTNFFLENTAIKYTLIWQYGVILEFGCDFV